MIIQTGDLLREGTRVIDTDSRKAGRIINVDVYDKIIPYRVEYRDGSRSWVTKGKVRELYEVGQRIKRNDGDFGEIVRVDEDDLSMPYRIHLDSGYEFWVDHNEVKKCTASVMKAELLEVGQRVQVDGRYGVVERVDANDSRQTYRIEYPGGQSAWEYTDEVVKVNVPSFKPGDKVTVDYPAFFESGKVYTVQEIGTAGSVSFIETYYEALPKMLTKVKSPSTELTMKVTTTVGIKGGENVKEIADKLDELDEIIKRATEVMADAGTQAEDLRNKIAESIVVESEKSKTPNQDRANVIQEAKNYIVDQRNGAGHYLTPDTSLTKVEFIVNEEKQTVVAILRGYATGKIRGKGKAKASQGDVFNVHIGKAIALAKALGKDVPEEFIHAPQPDQVEVGMIVRGTFSGDKYELTGRATVDDGPHGRAFRTDGESFGWIGEEQVEIIEDTNADYSKGGK